MLLSGITTLGKTTLVIAAALFITWAIVTAIFVPRRNPHFPRRLDAYILVSAIFFIAQMSAIVWVSETQEVEEAHAAEGAGGGEGEEAGGGEEGGTPTTPEAPAAGDAAAGKEVFASAGCEACHTLADAGSTGTVGPSLDEAKPSADLVVERVTNGMGAMPAFKGQLSEKQIQDVAAYVSSVAGSS
jgi:mono/diheme cytochrome c family protein